MDEHDLPTRNELSTYGICQVLQGVWAWERGYVLHAKMQEMNYKTTPWGTHSSMRLAWLFISFHEISHPLESTVFVQRFVLVQISKPSHSNCPKCAHHLSAWTSPAHNDRYPRPPPSILHTASDQRLEVGMALEPSLNAEAEGGHSSSGVGMTVMTMYGHSLWTLDCGNSDDNCRWLSLWETPITLSGLSRIAIGYPGGCPRASLFVSLSYLSISLRLQISRTLDGNPGPGVWCIALPLFPTHWYYITRGMHGRAWASTCRCWMRMEHLHVLNVHGAVRHVLKCAWSSCMCMSSECESDGEHSTT